MTRWPLLRALAIVLVALAVAVVALIVLPALGHTPTPDAPPIVRLPLPVGPGGLGVDPGGLEQPAQGPGAIAVGPDDTIWVADLAPRVLGFDRAGRVTATLDLAGQAAGVADLAVGDRGIVALDPSRSRVLVVNPTTGAVDLAAGLPDAEAGTSAGLSGLSLGPRGEILLELHGGTEIVRLEAMGDPAQVTPLDVRPSVIGPITVRWPLADGPVRIACGAGVIEVERPAGAASGVHLLAATARGIDVLVTTTLDAADGSLLVTRALRRYAPDGRLIGVAAAPRAAIWVPSPLALDLDGAYLALVVHVGRVEVVRVPFGPPA